VSGCRVKSLVGRVDISCVGQLADNSIVFWSLFVVL
jgi:hypothetical protein